MSKKIMQKMMLMCLLLAGCFILSGSAMAACSHSSKSPDRSEYLYVSDEVCQRYDYDVCNTCGVSILNKTVDEKHQKTRLSGYSYAYYTDDICWKIPTYYCGQCKEYYICNDEVENTQHDIRDSRLLYSYISDDICHLETISTCYNCQNEVKKEEDLKHNWCRIDWNYDYVSDDVCRYTEVLVCSQCNRSKTVTEDQAHNTDDWYLYTSNTYSDTQHELVYECRCCNCNHSLQKTELQDHSWDIYDTTYLNGSAKQHTVTVSSSCTKCSQTKKEVLTENHDWTLSWAETPVAISGTQHSIKKHYYCCKLDNATTTYTAKANHTFNKYGVCTG